MSTIPNAPAIPQAPVYDPSKIKKYSDKIKKLKKTDLDNFINSRRYKPEPNAESAVLGEVKKVALKIGKGSKAKNKNVILRDLGGPFKDQLAKIAEAKGLGEFAKNSVSEGTGKLADGVLPKLTSAGELQRKGKAVYSKVMKQVLDSSNYVNKSMRRRAKGVNQSLNKSGKSIFGKMFPPHPQDTMGIILAMICNKIDSLLAGFRKPVSSAKHFSKNPVLSLEQVMKALNLRL